MKPSKRRTCPLALRFRRALLYVCAAAGIACVNPKTGTSRYAGLATYVAQASGSPEAVPVNVELRDCDGVVTLRIGDRCSLRGTWAVDDEDFSGRSQGLTWVMGTVLLLRDQTCSVPLGDGEAVLRVANGFARVTGGRVLQLQFDGSIASGVGAGRRATFAFAAPPVGSMGAPFCASRW
jgi:hypothetical protein